MYIEQIKFILWLLILIIESVLKNKIFDIYTLGVNTFKSYDLQQFLYWVVFTLREINPQSSVKVIFGFRKFSLLKNLYPTFKRYLEEQKNWNLLFQFVTPCCFWEAFLKKYVKYFCEFYLFAQIFGIAKIYHINVPIL